MDLVFIDGSGTSSQQTQHIHSVALPSLGDYGRGCAVTPALLQCRSSAAPASLSDTPNPINFLDRLSPAQLHRQLRSHRPLCELAPRASLVGYHRSSQTSKELPAVVAPCGCCASATAQTEHTCLFRFPRGASSAKRSHAQPSRLSSCVCTSSLSRPVPSFVHLMGPSLDCGTFFFLQTQTRSSPNSTSSNPQPFAVWKCC